MPDNMQDLQTAAPTDLQDVQCSRCGGRVLPLISPQQLPAVAAAGGCCIVNPEAAAVHTALQQTVQVLTAFAAEPLAFRHTLQKENSECIVYVEVRAQGDSTGCLTRPEVMHAPASLALHGCELVVHQASHVTRGVVGSLLVLSLKEIIERPTLQLPALTAMPSLLT